MYCAPTTDTTPDLSPEQVEFDIGYGVVTYKGTGLLTTSSGVSMAELDSRGVRGQIELGEGIDLSVEGGGTTQAGTAEHQVALYGHLGR